jgi:hypothetical protein
MQQTPQSDEAILRYLLGLATDTECETIETAYLSSEDEYERVAALKDELIDDYLDNQLEAGERQAFEDHFLSAGQHRERLQFVRALRLMLPHTSTDARPAAAERSSWFAPAFGLRRLAWASAAVLAATLLCSALLVLQNQRLSRQALVSKSEQRDLAQQVQALKEQVKASQSQATPNLLGQPTAASASPVIIAVLSPGLLRSGGTYTQISIPPHTYIAQLKLELLTGDYPSYRATVQPAEGYDVLSQGHLRPNSRHQITLLVPTDRLLPGDYQILVSGENEDGTYQSIATYSFRVVR